MLFGNNQIDQLFRLHIAAENLDDLAMRRIAAALNIQAYPVAIVRIQRILFANQDGLRHAARAWFGHNDALFCDQLGYDDGGCMLNDADNLS